MANVKIPDLAPALGPLTGQELMEVSLIQGNPGAGAVSRRVTTSQVAGVNNSFIAAPRIITDSPYTLLTTDYGLTLLFPNLCSIILPATFPAGFWCNIRRQGGSAVTWATEAGASVTAYPSGSAVVAQYGQVRLATLSNTTGTNAAWAANGNIG